MAVLYRDPSVPPAPAEYRAVAAALPADALLADGGAAWASAQAISWGPIPYRTRFRALWCSSALVVRFDCEDASPWHTKTQRDEPLWEEEVVEIFLDPEGRGEDYAEVEISPANVVCDLRVRRGWPALDSEIGWTYDGLRTLVSPWCDVDAPATGWTATAILPWEGLASLSAEAARRLPPTDASRWRFNVFRIKRPGGPASPEHGAIYAAWSVPDGPSFHVPAAFRTLVFEPAADTAKGR